VGHSYLARRWVRRIRVRLIAFAGGAALAFVLEWQHPGLEIATISRRLSYVAHGVTHAGIPQNKRPACSCPGICPGAHGEPIVLSLQLIRDILAHEVEAPIDRVGGEHQREEDDEHALWKRSRAAILGQKEQAGAHESDGAHPALHPRNRLRAGLQASYLPRSSSARMRWYFANSSASLVTASASRM
jgi:hypothetical protein